MSPELIGISSIGVALAALTIAALVRLETRLNKQFSELRSDHKALDARISSLEGEVHELRVAIKGLSTRMSALEDAFREVRAEVR